MSDYEHEWSKPADKTGVDPLFDFKGDGTAVIGAHYSLAALGAGLSGYVIDLQGDCAVKIFDNSGLHDPRLHCEREAHFLQALKETGLVLPEYLAHGIHSDGVYKAAPILTMSRLNAEFRQHGEVLTNNMDDLAPLGRELGGQLAQLHALTPRRFHEDKQRTVLQTMMDQTRNFDMNADNRRWFYRDLAQKVAELEKTVRPVFCHGDFNLGNVGFDPETGDISALIDFAYSGYGMPETDFLYLQEPDLLPAAIESYEAQTGKEISPERLQAVALVNNYRAMVTFEHELSKDLSDNIRKHYEDERLHCHQDILNSCQSLGVANFVFTCRQGFSGPSI